MSDVYEVILVHADGREEWVPCLDAKELDDGRLAAEVLLGNVIFRKPGRWRKVPARGAQSLQEIGAEEWLKRREAEHTTAEIYGEALDKIRSVLGRETSDPSVLAADIRELVEAIESRCDALAVLKRIRGK